MVQRYSLLLYRALLVLFAYHISVTKQQEGVVPDLVAISRDSEAKPTLDNLSGNEQNSTSIEAVDSDFFMLHVAPSRLNDALIGADVGTGVLRKWIYPRT